MNLLNITNLTPGHWPERLAKYHPLLVEAITHTEGMIYEAFHAEGNQAADLALASLRFWLTTMATSRNAHNAGSWLRVVDFAVTSQEGNSIVWPVGRELGVWETGRETRWLMGARTVEDIGQVK